MSKELADRLEWFDEARQIAAQCWCDEETKHITLNPTLVDAVSKRIALWMETGARHAKNEEYWRERATKAEEAIAALRAEPVAWAVTNNGLYVAGNIFRYKPDAQMCMDNLNRMHPQEARTMVPLYAPPSRETDQRESSGIRIEGSQSPGSNPAPDVGQSKTGLTESHSGAPTQEADDLLRGLRRKLFRGGITAADWDVIDAYLSRKEQ